MTDQAPTSQNGGESDSGLLPTEIAKTDNAPTGQPATAQQLQQVEQQMSGFEKATLRWAKLAVGMSGVAALFVCLQWYEMHSGGTDTHDLAIAAKTQAEKMKSMSDAADRIRQAADGMVAQEQRIADSAEKSFKASTKQSENTLASLRKDQRAWVSKQTFTFGGVIPNVGQPFIVRTAFENTGRTPAINEQTCNTVEAKEGTERPKTYDCAIPKKVSKGIIPPGGGVHTDSEITPQLQPADRDAILHDQKVIWVYGNVTYDDVFGIHHRTDFCSRLLSGGDWMICEEHNSMN